MDDSTISLIGGLAKSAGTIYQSSRASSQAQQQYNLQNQLFQKYNNQTPEQTMAGIMALKQPLTDRMKQLIVQDITSQMAAKGQTGDTALVQEAIATAMAKAELDLFNQAEQAYSATRAANIAAQPRSAPPAGPTSMGDPFAALADYYKKKALAENPPVGALPPASATFTGTEASMAPLPPAPSGGGTTSDTGE